MSADASDLRARLQQTLAGSYTIERELGGGGMSRVFVAEEVRLKRQIVIKVLSPELAQGISVERFEREIQLAASLQQANIVPVLSAGDTDGLPWFTMPFVEGESLRVRLGRGPLSTTETIGVLRDVIRALSYAHSRGIVHRDIKPDNVLLSAGTAVVTDFGIAKAISAARTGSGNATLTQIGTSIGTPAYMAPEQAAGDPDVDFRADIYALGCMAYELLAGQPPFAGRTAQRVLAAHMGEAPRNVGELRPDLPAPLRDLVMQCLVKDPDGRPQSAAELGRALDSITSGQMTAPPAILLGGPAMFRRALLWYAVGVVATVILAKAAIVGIGLPDWVLPGALAIMALGLPAVLFTGYVQRVNRRMITATPTLTPGGTRSAALPPSGTMATLAIKAAPYVSWHRTARIGAIALTAFVLLVAGFMALRALGIGPAGSLVAAGKIKAKAPLLVTDFTIHNADTSLATVLGDATRSGLASSTVISLVTPAQAAGTLRLMQRPATTHIDVAVARDIAARDGAPAIVDGEATGVGNGYIVSMRLISAETGTELASFHETGDGPKGLIDAVDKLTRSLRSRIGESLRDVHATPPLALVTTGSLPALQKYSAGERADDVEGHFVAAAALLREAVAIDSTFAEAWRKLGVVLANGLAPQGQIDEALTQAYRYRVKLSPAEQLVITGSYFGSGPGRDRVRAIAAYRQLAASDPTWINNVAVQQMLRREFAPAESLFRLARSAQPDLALPYNNLTTALLLQGKWAAAESSIVVAKNRFPSNPGWLSGEFGRVRLRGEIDSAAAVTDVMRHSADPEVRARGIRLAGTVALMRGRVTEWSRLSTEGNQPSRDPPQSDTAVAAIADGWPLGVPARGVERLDAELARAPLRQLAEADRPYFDVAAAYALNGRADKARAILAEYQAEVKDTALRRQNAPVVHTVLGEIALSDHKPQVALTEFRQGDSASDGAVDACASCLPLELGRAFDAADQPDSAIAMYERFLATPSFDVFANSWAATTRWTAAVHFRLGELYEARNDVADAMKHYQSFIDLYQKADPEVQPRVTDARNRLARLRQRARQVG